MKLKKITALLMALTMLGACGAQENASVASEAAVAQSVSETETQTQTAQEPEQEENEAVLSVPEGQGVTFAAVSGDPEMFTDREKDPSYDAAETITLSDGASSSSSGNVTIDGDTITITGQGVYELSGSLSNGMVIVDVDKTEKVQLVLQEVSIHSETSAAIYVASADKVFVTLAEGTENTLSSGESYVAIDENNIDAAIYSKDDLALNGTGMLTITAPGGHGVVSKDDLVIAGGDYTVTASSSGIRANDSVRIAAGTVTVDAGKDGIHAENTDDTALGFIYIEGGDLRLKAGSDGVSASSSLKILGGSVLVEDSYEGLEANTIDISGGVIDITSQDDGINAAGGADGSGMGWGGMETQTESVSGQSPEIQISGGTVTIDSQGDCIDSNASFYISGGEIHVYGPTISGNGMLDFNVEGVITGGTLIGTSASNMEGNFSASSTQGAILLSVGTQTAGTDVTLTDADGKVLLSGTGKKDFNTVLISCPELAVGETYTITAGEFSQEITLETLLYGAGGMGGKGGRGGF